MKETEWLLMLGLLVATGTVFAFAIVVLVRSVKNYREVLELRRRVFWLDNPGPTGTDPAE